MGIWKSWSEEKAAAGNLSSSLSGCRRCHGRMFPACCSRLWLSLTCKMFNFGLNKKWVAEFNFNVCVVFCFHLKVGRRSNHAISATLCVLLQEL